MERGTLRHRAVIAQCANVRNGSITDIQVQVSPLFL